MSYARLFYHIIWATKRREPLINDENRQAIYPCIVDKVVTLNGFVHALNGMPDHVHLVVTIPATIPIARFVGQVKGSSSHLASRIDSSGVIVPFAWQDEYGVLTVSESHLPTVIRYVECQQQHHATNKVNRTLELCGRF